MPALPYFSTLSVCRTARPALVVCRTAMPVLNVAWRCPASVAPTATSARGAASLAHLRDTSEAVSGRPDAGDGAAVVRHGKLIEAAGRDPIVQSVGVAPVPSLTYRIAVESLKMYRPTRDVFAACSVVPFVVVLVTAVTVDAVGAGSDGQDRAVAADDRLVGAVQRAVEES
jgi:hypothetical protein